jgi:hypothetical protein
MSPAAHRISFRGPGDPPVNQHPSSGSKRCNRERKNPQHEDRGIGVRVQCVRQAEDVLDEVNEGHAHPCSASRDPAATTRDARGSGCGRKQHGHSDDWTDLAFKRNVVHVRDCQPCSQTNGDASSPRQGRWRDPPPPIGARDKQPPDLRPSQAKPEAETKGRSEAESRQLGSARTEPSRR